MDTSYTAHIITGEAVALGDPEITVISNDDEVIAAYEWAGESDPQDVLQDNGWWPVGDRAAAREQVEPGYYLIPVSPQDWEGIVSYVTVARGQADVERDRQDRAWRHVIRAAMHTEDTSATRIAKAAQVSRERAYQIRDDRR